MSWWCIAAALAAPPDEPAAIPTPRASALHPGAGPSFTLPASLSDSTLWVNLGDGAAVFTTLEYAVVGDCTGGQRKVGHRSVIPLASEPRLRVDLPLSAGGACRLHVGVTRHESDAAGAPRDTYSYYEVEFWLEGPPGVVAASVGSGGGGGADPTPGPGSPGPRDMTVVIDGYELNQSALSRHQQGMLRERLKGVDLSTVRAAEVTGFACNIGSASAIRLTSEARAHEAEWWITRELGLPVEPTVLGRGQNLAVCSEATEACRRRNRRVVIHLHWAAPDASAPTP